MRHLPYFVIPIAVEAFLSSIIYNNSCHLLGVDAFAPALLTTLVYSDRRRILLIMHYVRKFATRGLQFKESPSTARSRVRGGAAPGCRRKSAQPAASAPGVAGLR